MIRERNEVFADDPRAREAAYWLFRLTGDDLQPEEVAQWQQWLAASPDNQSAFERVEQIWDAPASLPSVPWPSDSEVAMDNYDASIPVSQANQQRPSKPARMHRYRALSLAAAILVCVAVGLLWIGLDTSPRMATQIGENRSFGLEDGSRLTLGGASTVRADLSDNRRTVQLTSGEAFFDVAHDPSRPFVVIAGDARITAIGTAFSVRHTGSRIHVAVASGIVGVTTADGREQSIAAGGATLETRVYAGQQASVTAGVVTAPEPTAIPAVLARKSGRLQYAGEPLQDVVADLNRYSTTPIEVEGAAAQLLITGAVLEHDPRGWLEGLGKALPVDITFGEERIVIRER